MTVKRWLLPAAAILAMGALLVVGERPKPASAGLDNVLLVNPGLCLALASPPPSGCTSDNGFEYFTSSGDVSLKGVADGLAGGSAGSKITPAAFQTLANFGSNQIHQQDGLSPGLSRLAVLAFVDNRAPVTFHTTAGFFTESGAATYRCLDTDLGNPDPDCGSTSTNLPPYAPDGVVVAYLVCTPATCATLGTQHLTVEQNGIVYPIDFTVVGEPRTVTFLTLEKDLQAGVGNDATTGKPDCPFQGSLPFIQKALAEAEKTVLVARALDINGTQVAGAWYNWSVDDPTKAVVSQPVTPTLNLGGFGIGAPNIVCALQGATAGSVKVTAQMTRTVSGISVDPFADPSSQPPNLVAGSVTYAVHALPTKMTLTAAPAQIPCDGTTTSTVSATLTDDAGNAAIGGTEVKFDVQVLGTANPIDTTTNDKGIATSVISPLSADSRGLPVIVTVPVTGNQQSILVQCSQAAAGLGTAAPGAQAAAGGPGTAAPGASAGGGAPAGVAAGTMLPPKTGTAGASRQSGVGIPMWALAALALGSVALVAGGVVVHRAT